VTAEVPLNPIINRTGDVWHILLPALSKDLLYGWRVGGPFSPEDGLRFDDSKILVDPYAKVSPCLCRLM
jgi:isoamylase